MIMKITKYLKKVLATTAAVMLFAVVGMSAQTSAAVPYSGETTPPLPAPQFNGYTGVPSEGDESDFFRVKLDGTASYSNSVSDACNAGTKFLMRVYVHNGASQYKNDNGNGPSVAKNTKVKVTIPGNQASTFNSTAAISASNAPTVTDGNTINCNGKQVKLSYITGSAQQWTSMGGTQALSDSIVTTGAPIGTVSPNGDVWGCWDQRVWVILKVEVKEVPPAPSVAACVAPTVATDNNARKVTVTANGSATNAQIIGYEIDWGDGTKSNKQTDTHTYANYGKYTIKTRVQAKYADGTVKWLDGSVCNKEVEFKKPAVPKPVCEAMDVKVVNGRTVTITLKLKNMTEAKAAIKNITYDFGDGNKKDTKDTTVTYTYQKDGTFKITAKVVVTIDGKDHAIDTSDCAQQVVFTPNEPPTITPIPVTPLPVTGAGGVAAIFAGVASVIGGAHYIIRRRHL
jgi:hypothetical protein